MRPEAKEVWDHSAAELRGMNNLYAADDVVLMMFSCVVNNFVRAQKIVDASEILVVRRHEGDGERQRPVLMRNPALAVVRDSVAAARNLARELGLTPGGRAMIGLAQSQNPDLRRAADLLS
jgi:P27 family predicted phage terminase small subunit